MYSMNNIQNFQKRFSNLIQQVNKLKIIIFVLAFIIVLNCYYCFLNLLLQH
jgi:hypothetical protein